MKHKLRKRGQENPGGLTLCAVALCAASAFGQSWQTVDDFQYAAGQDTVNYGLTVAPDGKLFAAGFGSDHALVMSSSDGGSTWSVPLDDFDLGGWGARYTAGIVSDSVGNLYAAGFGYPTSDTSMVFHWIVRRSTDGGANWSTVDDYAPGGPTTQAKSIAVDAAGNVYVAGVADFGNGPQSWTIRKGIGGMNFATVDTFNSGGAHALFAHPTAGILAVGSAQIAKTKPPAWIVRRSLDGGSTWSIIDIFQLSSQLGSRALSAGADALGNIYVVGTGELMSKGTAYGHWVVRRSMNGGSSWTSVDSYQFSTSGDSLANRFAADSNGNLYVSGTASATKEGAAHWIVRKYPRGTGAWQTDDDFQFLPGQSSEPQAMTPNGFGNVFIGGLSFSSSGSHWLVRRR
jgi:hypothetical protein